MNVNYQIVLDNIIKEIGDKKPKLLLHSCCAPCSSYVLEYLCTIFDITVYYYNPNIYPEQEFYFRRDEQQRLVDKMGLSDAINVIACDYDSEKFYKSVKGLEDEPEGSKRCAACFELRLEKCAEYAKNNGFDYFTTTLTISPHKNSQVLNEIGAAVADKYGVKYLFSDFKKKNGYKRSCEISAQFGLYRQDYCGCVFSKNNKK